jgi:hypothetical protein
MTGAASYRFPLPALTAVVAISVSGCGAQSRFTRTAQADFFEVRGEYTLVVPQSSFMESAFGSGWESQSLFYSMPMISPEGERILHTPGSRKPLVKGRPVFILPRTGWRDGPSAVYSLETGLFVTLHFNLQAHTINADAPVKPLYGVPRLLPDGGLVFD